MNNQLIDPEFLEILACPVCRSDVLLQGQTLVCINDECQLRFPVVDSIPVMLTEGIEHHEHQKQYFDREFKTYTRYRLENWRLSYLKRIFTALRLGNDENDLYLDVGVGGSGYTVIEAARIGCKSIGVDVSLEGIKRARHFSISELGCRNNLCNFVVCLAESLPFKRSSFTKISCIAVLEHVPNDIQAISEIARVAKPSGKTFITVPNSFNRIIPIFWLPYYIHDKKLGHLRHYKDEELTDKLSECGLALQSVQYTAHLTKMLQTLLCFIFPNLIWKSSSKLWWKLEEMDLKKKDDKRGLQLHIIAEKLG